MKVITLMNYKSVLVIIFAMLITSKVAANDLDEEGVLPPIISILLDDQLPVFSSGAFLESDGLIVIEMESLNAPADWQLKPGDGAIGSYIEWTCLLYTSPSPRDLSTPRMPSSA